MKTLAIALNTFREAVRDRILYALLGFALLMIGASVLVAELTLGEYDKIIRDIGLASISVFGLLISIFVGIGLVWKEIDRKTIYTIASKPIARWQFLLGKYLGLVITLAVEVLVMTVGYWATLLLTGVEWTAALGPAIWLTFVEMMVVTAIAIVFSCFSTPTLSALFTLGLTLIGRLTAALKEFADESGSEALAKFAAVAYPILPDLQTFNIRTAASYGKAVDWEFTAYATGYGFVWIAILLAVGTAIFQFRDFK